MGRRRAAPWSRALAAGAVAGCCSCAAAPWIEPEVVAPDCGPALEVESREELVRLFRERLAPAPSSEVTGDLRATADLVLTPADLGFDEDCAACLPQLFVPGSRIRAGITTTDAGFVIRAGASFRLLVEAVEREPGVALTRAWIRAPCGTPCPEGQRRCPADDVCYPDGERLCAACTDNPPERCACAGPGGTSLAWGAECALFEPGGDAVRPGVCRWGGCRVEGGGSP